jgi:D-alanine-D-alanine ligase
VLASAVAMDKQLFKELMTNINLPICKYISVSIYDLVVNKDNVIKKILGNIGNKCFVKPANMGSSIGISKVNNPWELEQALELAGKFDKRIIVEEAIPCRELEIAVLGSHTLETSAVGEIIPKLLTKETMNLANETFYDYKAKYLDDSYSHQMSIPSNIEDKDRIKIEELACQAFRAIDGWGYARVDFFKHKETGEIYINEINTIPGFTKRSMFPELWQYKGYSLGYVIERIIDLGYERHNAKNSRQARV